MSDQQPEQPAWHDWVRERIAKVLETPGNVLIEIDSENEILVIKRLS